MRLFTPKITDVLVVIGLAGFVILYSLSAWKASNTPENMILILPVSAIALILCAIELIQQVLGKSQSVERGQPVKEVAPIMGLFTAYVLSLEWIGFDVATVLFVASFLLVQGERRWVWIVGYSICFGLVMSVFFAQMLPYPMPMSLLPTDY
ncbi:tripartite tricarboxylate transporter TctB family protein [Vibrio rumoiensis]|uniref:tripartite tricarboxylate transporter TctB family protein n=1 Tax=Vibrio rumoiensis TaxID=76258 RepID=UPI003AA7DE04